MRKKRLTEKAYVEGILKGDILTLSRAITLVESTLESDRKLAQSLIDACMPHTGKSFRLGITGVPGVGKSTFIDSFGSYLIDQGMKIAILAIDPSSLSTRGSILGDKTRMNRLAHHPKAFIRPSPTAGTLGGVTQKTRENLLLCEAAGFDVVIIETVGVGQSEIAVRDMVDFFLLLMLPNAGDELQGIKKGIMEMADAIAVNKADGVWIDKAMKARTSYSQALRLFPPKASGWKPKTVICSGLEGAGMKESWDIIQSYRRHISSGDYLRQLREDQAIKWFEDSVKQELIQHFYESPLVAAELQKIKEDIGSQRRSPIEAAQSLITKWLQGS